MSPILAGFAVIMGLALGEIACGTPNAIALACAVVILGAAWSAFIVFGG